MRPGEAGRRCQRPPGPAPDAGVLHRCKALARTALLGLSLCGACATVQADEEWQLAMRAASSAALTGDLEDAVRSLESAARRAEAFASPDWRLAASFYNLSAVLTAQGEYSAARTALDRAGAVYRALFADAPVPRVGTLVGSARMALAQGELAAASAALEQALTMAQAAPGAGNASAAMVNIGLAELADARGALDDAERFLARAVATLGTGTQALRVTALRRGADIAARRGRRSRAAALLEEAGAALSAAPEAPDNAVLAAGVGFQRAMLASLWEQPAAALAALSDSARAWEAAGARDHPEHLQNLLALARAQAELGAIREAEVTLQRAAAAARRGLRAQHPVALALAHAQAQALIEAGRHDEAARHIQALMEAAPETSPPWHDLILLARAQAGAGATKQARVALAEARQALSDREAIVTPIASAQALADLANVFGELGDSGEQSTLLARSLAIYVAHDLTRSPVYLNWLVAHAEALATHTSLPEARAAITAAVDHARQMTTPAGLPAARALALEAQLRQQLGRAEAAAETMTEALAAAVAAAGDSSLPAAYMRMRKGRLELAAGRVSAGLEALTAAAGVAQKALPDRHPALLGPLAAQASALIEIGRLREAAAVQRTLDGIAKSRSVQGHRRARLELLGARLDHAQGRVAAARARLAAAQAALAHRPQSGALQRLSLRLREAGAVQQAATGDLAGAIATLGEAAPNDMAARASWVAAGADLIRTGRHAQARNVIERWLEQTPRHAAAEGQILTALALVLRDAGNLGEALARHDQAVDADTRHWGAGHPQTLRSRLASLATLAHAGRFDTARDTLRSTRSDLEATLPPQHPLRAELHLAAAQVARLRTDYGTALSELADAQRILESALRPEHPDLVELHIRRAELLTERAQYGEAASLLTRATSTLARVYGDAHPSLAGAHLALADLHRRRHALDLADAALEAAGRSVRPQWHDAPLAAKLQLARIRRQAAAQNWHEVARLAALADDDAAIPAAFEMRLLAAGAALANGDLPSAEQLVAQLRQATDAQAVPAQPQHANLVATAAAIQLRRGRTADASAGFRDAVEQLLAVDSAHLTAAMLRVPLAAALLRSGDADAALRQASAGLATIRTRHGTEHPALVPVLLMEGRALGALGRFDEAEARLQRAGSVAERGLEAQHPDRLYSAAALAGLYLRLGKLDAAQLLLQHAAATPAEGDATPLHQRYQIMVADLRMRQGRFDDAAARLGSTLAAIEAGAGATSPTLATPLARMAAVELRRDRLDAAQTHARRALALLGEPPGAAAATALEAKASLAALAVRRGQADTAREALREARQIANGHLPAGHPAWIAALRTIGSAWLRSTTPAEALEPLGAALRLARAGPDPEHSESGGLAVLLARAHLATGNMAAAGDALATLTSATDPLPAALETAVLSARAAHLGAQMRYEEAIQMAQTSAARTEQLLGNNHPLYAERLAGHGALLIRAGRSGDAEPLLRQALAVLEQALGDTHPDLIPVLGQLAAASAVLGRRDSALQHLQRQLALVEVAYGENDPRALPALRDLAQLRIDAGQREAARALLIRALDIARLQPSADSLETARLRLALGALAVETRRYDAARRHYELALEPLQAGLESDDGTIAATLRSLAALELLRGGLDAAAGLLQRAGSGG